MVLGFFRRLLAVFLVSVKTQSIDLNIKNPSFLKLAKAFDLHVFVFHCLICEMEIVPFHLTGALWKHKNQINVWKPPLHCIDENYTIDNEVINRSFLRSKPKWYPVSQPDEQQLTVKIKGNTEPLFIGWIKLSWCTRQSTESMLKIAYVCAIALYQNSLSQGSPKNVVLATLILLWSRF